MHSSVIIAPGKGYDVIASLFREVGAGEVDKEDGIMSIAILVSFRQRLVNFLYGWD